MKQLFDMWLNMMVEQNYVAVIIMCLIGAVMAFVGLTKDDGSSNGWFVLRIITTLYVGFCMFTVMLMVNANV